MVVVEFHAATGEGSASACATRGPSTRPGVSVGSVALSVVVEFHAVTGEGRAAAATSVLALKGVRAFACAGKYRPRRR